MKEIDMENLNKYFDHTLLAADASEEDIRVLCEEAMKYKFCSVCVNSCYTAFAAKALSGSDVKVATVVGFPLGAASTGAKIFEAACALRDGAGEIDMVINIGHMKDCRYDEIKNEIAEVAETCHRYGALLKVITETCLLTDEEITVACGIAADAGADFVKTSTGFSSGGATPEHVALMKKSVAGKCLVKASGGIRTLTQAMAMINAGADRLGASASVSIMNEKTASDK